MERAGTRNFLLIKRELAISRSSFGVLSFGVNWLHRKDAVGLTPFLASSPAEMGDVYDDDLEIRFDDFSKNDSDYEYDAPNFFDFTSPELPSEAEVAERWFRFPPSFLPSREFFDGEASICSSVDCPNSDGLNDDADVRMAFQDSTSNRLLQKYKPKSPSKPYLPRSSTLLKPTASHLAKLCRPDDHTTRCSGSGRSPRTPPSPLYHSWEVVAPNRQKLEFSYSKKNQSAHLKGQSSFGQKSPKMVRTKSLDMTPLKSKFTTPKGPELETTQRSQRQRSIKGTVQEDIEKSKHYNCKAQPLSRKVCNL